MWFSLPPKKVKAKTGIESARVNILQQVDVVGDAYNLTPIQRLQYAFDILRSAAALVGESFDL